MHRHRWWDDPPTVARLEITSRPSTVHCHLDLAEGVEREAAVDFIRKWLVQAPDLGTWAVSSEPWDVEMPLRYAVVHVGHLGEEGWPHEPTADERAGGAEIEITGPDLEGPWKVVGCSVVWSGVPDSWPDRTWPELVHGALAWLEG